MKFIADFHIHSKYSRATAKNLDLENLYIAGQLKGIHVVGTGDFTHPEWFSEIKNKLEPDEFGLYKLKTEIERVCDQQVPAECRRPVRFILVSELSNIYKKNDKTRKNHNLVFMPDMRSAEVFNARLDKIGNIQSDGRPILGLDARDLLEIVLDTSQEGFLIPAHIWTPWFSLFGSKSGFDSLKECFEDLSEYIFAVETGLSSDPEMNWRIKGLDGLTLISNSDAHSPLKLGREANLFNTTPSFATIKQTLSSGDPRQFLGTLEFYPEEGKYHLDGHRKCQVRSWPQDTIHRQGICPVCAKPMTLGVLYRVEQLADRAIGKKPERHHPYYSMIPLHEILSELLGVGPGTKTVHQAYQRLLRSFGPELDILHRIPVNELNRSEVPLLSEAIQRTRNKKVHVQPGYDGDFGKIRIFDPHEKASLMGQKSLFGYRKSFKNIEKGSDWRSVRHEKIRIRPTIRKPPSPPERSQNPTLNASQREAVRYAGQALMIVAGPGTGKTLTLTHRIAHLAKQRQISSKNVIALTFTHKAAEEMNRRLRALLGDPAGIPLATTFHSFCLGILEEIHGSGKYQVVDDNIRRYFIREAMKRARAKGVRLDIRHRDLLDWIVNRKQSASHSPGNWFAENTEVETAYEFVFTVYQELLQIQRLWDYDDLIFQVLQLFENNKQIREKYQNRYEHVFVDEYQDLNQGQYRVIQTIAPSGKGICVIGDPDQSIYAFRGSDVAYFHRFVSDYPQARVIRLSQNYRSTQTILDASRQMVHGKNKQDIQERLYAQTKGGRKIRIVQCPTEKAEAVFIGREIEQLVGGMGFHSLDFGKIDSGTTREERSFSDLAVLVRTIKQTEIIAETFHRAGIPYQLVSKSDNGCDSRIQTLTSCLKLVEKTGAYVDFERCLPILEAGISPKSLEIWKTWAFDNRYSFVDAINNTRKYPVREIKRDQQLQFDRLAKTLDTLQNQLRGLSVKEKLTDLDRRFPAMKPSDDMDASSDAFNEFMQQAESCGSDTQRFLNELNLCTDTDTYRPESEKVALMTIHASKGLEFPVVFIAGCEDGLIPHQRALGDAAAEDEERRLFYVAMTRAKETLSISFSKSRYEYGKKKASKPSPFLMNIARHYKQMDDSIPVPSRKKVHQQLKLF